MQLIYQHGVYAPLDASEDFTPPQSAGTLPLYIGTAPVHQLASPPKAGEPILIRTWREMESLLGYSDDWASFDLCEACYAHLRSRVGSVAPIAVINLVDPAKHKGEPKTIQATFTAGRAVVAAPPGHPLYRQDRLQGGGHRLRRQLQRRRQKPHPGGSDWLPLHRDGQLQRGGRVQDHRLGCGESHQQPGAPGLPEAGAGAHHPVLPPPGKRGGGLRRPHRHGGLHRRPLARFCQRRPGGGQQGGSPFPAGCRRAGQQPLQRLLAHGQVEREGVPPVGAGRCGDAAGGCRQRQHPLREPQQQAHRLRRPLPCRRHPGGPDRGGGQRPERQGDHHSGLPGRAVCAVGPHTAAYRFGKDMDFRDRFDATVRMAQYVANSFQLHNGSRIDATMRRSLVDTILNDFQAFLDQLRADGRILGGSIRFDESSNPESDMVTGDFVFDVKVSPGIPAKSITGRVRCTTEGLTTLFGGDQNA